MTFFFDRVQSIQGFSKQIFSIDFRNNFFSVHLLNASNGAGSDDAGSCFHLALKSSQNGPKNLTFFDRLQSIQFFSKQVLASTWKMIFSLLVYLMLLMALVCFHLALRIVKMTPKIWPFLTRFNRFSLFRNKFQHQFQKKVFSGQLLGVSNGAGLLPPGAQNSKNGPKNVTFFDPIQSIQFFSKQISASISKKCFFLPIYLTFSSGSPISQNDSSNLISFDQAHSVQYLTKQMFTPGLGTKN